MMNDSLANLLTGLNPEQLSAVTYPNQSLLVLAGAGSGKTKVLTSRIVWLLSTKQCFPQNILAVTFTNKAANEMRKRIEHHLPYSINDLWLGTFHSICHRLLRRYADAAGLHRNFQIIDTQDQLSIIKRILKESQTQADITPKELLQYINTNKEHGLRSTSPQLESNQKYFLLNNSYKIYEALCFRENLVDFGELLLRSLEMLNKHPEIKTNLQERFKYILVDEFQDTNNLQYRWLKLMSGQNTVIFAVGDDDQSIYSFRGANVNNMQKFMQDFSISEPIKLEQNYRSTGTILGAANHIISLNQNRIGKNLRTESEQGELIRFMQNYSELEESLFIAEEIQARQRSGQPYSSMAILYRNNAQSRSIEQTLFNANIPYKIYGGLRFYEREEIKHALSYLRLLVNPDDNQALLRVINFPNRGIGSKTIENLQQHAELRQSSIWSVLLTERLRNSKLNSFVQIIVGLQELIKSQTFPDLMLELIHRSGLITYYQEKKGDFQNKIDNLHELVSATTYFDMQNLSLLVINPEEVNLADKIVAFLANASLEAGERESKQSQTRQTDFVQLMTIHSSKGLEFDTVFLVGLEEGVFPKEYALNNRNELEEERRLMYVAITRARKNLYLTAASERFLNGRRTISLPSRFIAELPENFIHFLSGNPNLALEYTTIDNAPVSSIEPSTQSKHPYQLGALIKHNKFGTGVIIDIQEKKNAPLLKINFGKDGIKTIDSSIAKLEYLN